MLDAKPQKGTSLIELMVAITVGLILLAGVLTTVVRISTAGGESVKATRLNQQLREALDVMSRDLQRAGYVDWWNAWDDDDADGDPVDTNDGATRSALLDINSDGNADILDFYQTAISAIDRFGDISLYNVSSDGSSQSACTSNCNCILFSFDLDEDGSQGVTGSPAVYQDMSGFEQFGYRLKDEEIQTRTASNGNSHTCTNAAGGWQAITESDDVEVTTLAFSLVWAAATGSGNDSTVFPIAGTSAGALSTSCVPTDDDGDGVYGEYDETKCLWRRKVDITLAGRLTSDTDVQLSLQTDVKVKNDYLQISP